MPKKPKSGLSYGSVTTFPCISCILPIFILRVRICICTGQSAVGISIKCVGFSLKNGEPTLPLVTLAKYVDKCSTVHVIRCRNASEVMMTDIGSCLMWIYSELIWLPKQTQHKNNIRWTVFAQTTSAVNQTNQYLLGVHTQSFLWLMVHYNEERYALCPVCVSQHWVRCSN